MEKNWNWLLAFIKGELLTWLILGLITLGVFLVTMLF